MASSAILVNVEKLEVPQAPHQNVRGLIPALIAINQLHGEFNELKTLET